MRKRNTASGEFEPITGYHETCGIEDAWNAISSRLAVGREQIYELEWLTMLSK